MFYRTKVECAGLCLSIEACFGFQWSRSKENDLYSCKVFKRQELCKWNEEPSTVIYVGQNENIANCSKSYEYSACSKLSYLI